MKSSLYSKIRILASITFFFFASSCSNESEVVVLKNQINSVLQDAGVISIETNTLEWEELEAEYDALYYEYAEIKEMLTKEERVEINKSIGKFEAIKAKRALKDFEGEVKDLTDQVESFFEEITK
jgi:hypothetical protein